MTVVVKTLTALAGLAFACAVVSNFLGEQNAIFATAEGYSRAATNLALLAIAVALGGRDDRAPRA